MSSVNCSVNRKSPPCFSLWDPTICLSSSLILAKTACDDAVEASWSITGSVVTFRMMWTSPDQRLIKAALLCRTPMPFHNDQLAVQAYKEYLSADSPPQGAVPAHPVHLPNLCNNSVLMAPIVNWIWTIPTFTTTKTPYPPSSSAALEKRNRTRTDSRAPI